MKSERGGALIVGLLLLSLVSLLSLAGAAAARVELQLARNEQFRENAASAASAGIELAIRHVTTTDPESVPARLFVSLPGADRIDVRTRFLGLERALAQLPGQSLAGAHFEILSTGHAARGATDHQRVIVRRTIVSPHAEPADCEPVAAGVRCAAPDELRTLSWQRLPTP